MTNSRVAIVTGAAQGIGRSIALRLAAEGNQVVVVDLSFEKAQGVVREIEQAYPVRAHAVACDVSNETAIENLFLEAMKRFSRIDILVNNAGIYPFKPITDMTISDWDTVQQVNARSVFLTARAALRVLPSGGRIISISSVAAVQGFAGLTHYCASKGAIDAFTRALAIEVAPKGITVNAVAPGAIRTPGASGNEQTMRHLASIMPLERVGEPQDIANAVAYLASPQSNYVTGQVLVVDGGWTVKSM